MHVTHSSSHIHLLICALPLTLMTTHPHTHNSPSSQLTLTLIKTHPHTHHNSPSHTKLTPHSLQLTLTLITTHPHTHHNSPSHTKLTLTLITIHPHTQHNSPFNSSTLMCTLALIRLTHSGLRHSIILCTSSGIMPYVHVCDAESSIL